MTSYQGRVGWRDGKGGRDRVGRLDGRSGRRSGRGWSGRGWSGRGWRRRGWRDRVGRRRSISGTARNRRRRHGERTLQ